ncbi:MAG: helix-turn-helix domain-containing protein [Gammaproteobacteria bacterium]
MSTKIGGKSRQTLRKLEAISGEKLSLGNLLSAIREGDDVTQVEFAHKLGVSRQYLCELEHGRKVISPKTAAKFATLLGYSIAQFVKLAIQDELDRYHIPLHVEVYGDDQYRTA